MIRQCAIKHGWLAFIALLPMACGLVQGNQQESSPPTMLTEEERLVARDLAEHEIYKPANHLDAGEKIFFTRVELLPDSQADTTQRQVMVTHYRYSGNQTIMTRIDLNTNKVLATNIYVNVPTPLAEEEWTRALELAKADARLKKLLNDYGSSLHIEGKLSSTADVPDPQATQRQVHLLFRVGRNYLHEPRVVVDLATESVTVDFEPSL